MLMQHVLPDRRNRYSFARYARIFFILEKQYLLSERIQARDRENNSVVCRYVDCRCNSAPFSWKIEFCGGYFGSEPLNVMSERNPWDAKITLWDTLPIIYLPNHVIGKDTKRVGLI